MKTLKNTKKGETSLINFVYIILAIFLFFILGYIFGGKILGGLLG